MDVRKKLVVLVITDSEEDFGNRVRRQLPVEEFTIKVTAPAAITANRHCDYHVVDARQLTQEDARQLKQRLNSPQGVVVGGPYPHDPGLGKAGLPSLNGTKTTLPEVFETLDEIATKRGSLSPRVKTF